ncbi:MAG: YihY/virulence factor BrkB family protein [Flavobacteriaceae bacterium]|nr:YihY/virulence factor BrkB family protein [Flavobacteriaceae bacterium]
MSDQLEKEILIKEQVVATILKIPIIRYLVIIPKKIRLPRFEGLTLWDLIYTYVFGIIEGTFSSRAGSIAFSFFMALFPFLLFLLNLIPYLPIEPYHFIAFVEEILPPHTTEFFLPVIRDISENPRGGLLSFVFFLTIFLMTNGVNAIFSGFEYSYHVKINRTFFKQYFVALGVSISLAILLLFAITLLVYSKQYLGEINILQYSIFIFLIYLVIATLYYFGIKEGKKFRFFSIGSLVTTLSYILTTYIFGVYINNFSNYNELYGSIGALLIMMLYIWINSNLLLLGFELNATLQSLRNQK